MTEFLYGNERERDSKSQRKREMLKLQSLGEEVAALSPEQLDRMDLPEELDEAVRFYQTLKDREARRRQMQFIGTVMRQIDAEPIQRAIDRLDQLRHSSGETFHQLEIWRDALIAGDEKTLLEVTEKFALDASTVTRLARAAAAEKAANKPMKNSRALFRLLRRSMETENRPQ